MWIELHGWQNTNHDDDPKRYLLNTTYISSIQEFFADDYEKAYRAGREVKTEIWMSNQSGCYVVELYETVARRVSAE